MMIVNALLVDAVQVSTDGDGFCLLRVIVLDKNAM
jgi:hypothetical protein